MCIIYANANAIKNNVKTQTLTTERAECLRLHTWEDETTTKKNLRIYLSHIHDDDDDDIAVIIASANWKGINFI